MAIVEQRSEPRGRGLGRLVEAVMRAVSRQHANWAARRAERRAIAELRALGRAGLRDLALDQSEVTSVVRTKGAERRR